MGIRTRARRRLGALVATLAAVVLASSASQALADDPKTGGAGTGCFDGTRTRVLEGKAGAACAPTETTVTWNAAEVTAMRWTSGSITALPRGAGARVRVGSQPIDRKLPAGSWVIGADVLIANSLEPPTSFRCFMETWNEHVFVGGQLQDWGGAGGWHRTLTIRALVTLTAPDFVDVFCSHDQAVQTGGVFQAESVDVIAQKVDSVF
ncbi:hypothetical protein AB0I60_19390 [Actinosynnema sp. NPDC050436]|uniref:hypothetical protein n=1 Tax=Actinosynnema sp. NPDC050436 TaxID=3155659 RepID=UPI0033C1C037